MAAEASRQIISIEINYQVPNLPNLGLQSIRVHCHFDSSGGRVFELYIIVQNGLHKVESPEFLNFVKHENENIQDGDINIEMNNNLQDLW